MRQFKAAIGLVRASRRAYLACNLVYYGLVVGAMGAATLDRGLQQAVVDAVQRSLDAGGLAPIARVYASGNIPLAAGMTFAVNLLVGSFGSITLPSLIVPFGGLLVAMFRAVMWGLIFAPPTLQVTAGELVAGVLVALVVALEGQAYVLTMLAAYRHGRAWLWPASSGAADRRSGYREGLRQAASLYLLVIIVLAIAGLVEAGAAIGLMPGLMGA